MNEKKTFQNKGSDYWAANQDNQDVAHLGLAH